MIVIINKLRKRPTVNALQMQAACKKRKACFRIHRREFNLLAFATSAALAAEPRWKMSMFENVTESRGPGGGGDGGEARR